MQILEAGSEAWKTLLQGLQKGKGKASDFIINGPQPSSSRTFTADDWKSPTTVVRDFGADLTNSAKATADENAGVDEAAAGDVNDDGPEKKVIGTSSYERAPTSPSVVGDTALYGRDEYIEAPSAGLKDSWLLKVGDKTRDTITQETEASSPTLAQDYNANQDTNDNDITPNASVDLDNEPSWTLPGKKRSAKTSFDDLGPTSANDTSQHAQQSPNAADPPSNDNANYYATTSNDPNISELQITTRSMTTSGGNTTEAGTSSAATEKPISSGLPSPEPVTPEAATPRAAAWPSTPLLSKGSDFLKALPKAASAFSSRTGGDKQSVEVDQESEDDPKPPPFVDDWGTAGGSGQNEGGWDSAEPDTVPLREDWSTASGSGRNEDGWGSAKPHSRFQEFAQPKDPHQSSARTQPAPRHPSSQPNVNDNNGWGLSSSWDPAQDPSYSSGWSPHAAPPPPPTLPARDFITIRGRKHFAGIAEVQRQLEREGPSSSSEWIQPAPSIAPPAGLPTPSFITTRQRRYLPETPDFSAAWGINPARRQYTPQHLIKIGLEAKQGLFDKLLELEGRGRVKVGVVRES